MSDVRVVWVVPCYNEAARLNGGALAALVDEDRDLTLLFVNDGSRDETGDRLDELARQRPDRIRVMSLPTNRGKGEAVRLGMLQALRSDNDAAMVGYFDADLATPVSEIKRLTDVMRGSDADLLIGARVAMLGRQIHRRAVRHYMGRAFATAASLVLGLTVYDTQCGVKLFRRTPALLTALEEAFHSKWLFDVELIGRLASSSGSAAVHASRMLEEPLREWSDVEGSKVRLRHFVIAVVDLAKVTLALRRRGEPKD